LQHTEQLHGQMLVTGTHSHRIRSQIKTIFDLAETVETLQIFVFTIDSFNKLSLIKIEHKIKDPYRKLEVKFEYSDSYKVS
jgi:hypothetical protein